jgi:mRNA interferase MazF
MQRGDIVRVDLPAPKGAPGHEQIGERPAIVVQASETIPNLSTIVVVPLTGNADAIRFPGTFRLTANSENGLDTDSVALTFQVRSIDKRRVVRSIGRLSDVELAELKRHLGNILGI